jgi:ABC-2 type transport system permease protein
MAVYKRVYKTYSGPRTVAWSRFWVLTRYSYARLFQSRLLVLFLAACLFYPVGCLAFIYFSHNEQLLALLSLGNAKLPAIDGKFFFTFCRFQGVLASLVAAVVGPGLVSPDLANGALALYFSRPFSRTQYVSGKLTTLALLLSLITWIPGLVLYGTQVCLMGWEWTTANLWLGWSIFFALALWIAVLSLIALALSACVKWKIAASALMLAVLYAGAGFGAVINNVLRTHYGGLISLNQIIYTIWGDLFRYDWGAQLGSTEAWVVLVLGSACCLWLLAKRVRPFEVVA